jgi:hypothetical protein
LCARGSVYLCQCCYTPIMDAADDREVKLQRASGDLVKEFLDKLPSLLWKPQNAQTHVQVPRRWTLASKTERLVNLVRTISASSKSFC